MTKREIESKKTLAPGQNGGSLNGKPREPKLGRA